MMCSYTRMQQGLLPYKGVLNALLPILKKGNVEAFSKKDEVRDIKIKLDASELISKWYKDEALPFLAKSIDNIQRILPAMIYASTGIKDVAGNGDMKNVTIGCDDAMGMYKEGY